MIREGRRVVISGIEYAEMGARLAREGWMPPVDPLLLEARKLLADSAENKEEAHTYLAGGFDHWSEFQIVLAALRRGIEIGEGR